MSEYTSEEIFNDKADIIIYEVQSNICPGCSREFDNTNEWEAHLERGPCSKTMVARCEQNELSIDTINLPMKILTMIPGGICDINEGCNMFEFSQHIKCGNVSLIDTSVDIVSKAVSEIMDGDDTLQPQVMENVQLQADSASDTQFSSLGLTVSKVLPDPELSLPGLCQSLNEVSDCSLQETKLASEESPNEDFSKKMIAQLEETQVSKKMTDAPGQFLDNSHHIMPSETYVVTQSQHGDHEDESVDDASVDIVSRAVSEITNSDNDFHPQVLAGVQLCAKVDSNDNSSQHDCISQDLMDQENEVQDDNKWFSLDESIPGIQQSEVPNMVIYELAPNAESCANNESGAGDLSVADSTIKNKENSHYRSFLCSFQKCRRRFLTQKAVDIHNLCHVTPVIEECEKFTCYLCEAKFNKWVQCSHHLWQQHEIDADLFSCDICCVYKAPTKVLVAQHKKIHSEFKEYVCQVCGKAFSQLAQLSNHCVIHKKQTGAPLPIWAQKHQCKECGKYLSDEKALKSHNKAIHLKKCIFSCEHCRYQTTRKGDLKSHLRTHTKEKPYRCKLCSRDFSDPTSLQRHHVSHVPTKHLKCPACQFTTSQKPQFKKHIDRKHHSLDKEFKCQMCFYSCLDLTEFLRHASSHQAELVQKVLSLK